MVVILFQQKKERRKKERRKKKKTNHTFSTEETRTAWAVFKYCGTKRCGGKMSQKLHCRIEKKRNIVIASFSEQCRKFLRCDFKSLDLMKNFI